MNPERWQQIKRVYHAALELEPGRREEFLKEACGGDESLFEEVTSLLAQKENSEGFFDSPALQVIAKSLAEDEAHKPQRNLTGHTLLHYRIEKKIGQGGMGEVFLAQDTSLNRKVALKLLPPEMQRDPVAHKRFLREARSAAALDNPFICSIHEVREFEGKDFIVMEYVDGQTLTEKLHRGRLPLHQSLQFATEVAEALQAAHGKGIIHRDLKPSNIMLTKTGHAKVMDFGLAKQIVPLDGIEKQAESVTTMTRSGMTLGTLAYMSPEQVRGEAADVRSDIFSFGLVLYEMLTGRHPFRKESPMETASAIMHEEPRPVSAITKGIPADLEKLIGRCLRKDPEQRIQHMGDAKLALTDLTGDLDSGRLQVAPDPSKLASSVRHAIAMAAVVVLIAAGWYWLSRQRRAEPEAMLSAVPLTSYPGFEDCPSFSPDGNYVVFQWQPQGPGAKSNIYIKQIGVEPPFRLTNNRAKDFSPAWSPDGRFIAFLRELSPTKCALMLIPQRGGQERVLGESDASLGVELPGPYLAWTPDSKWLLFPSSESGTDGCGLFLLSVETLQKRRLTTPLAGRTKDSTPALSPDGRTLAFTRLKESASYTYLLRLGENFEPQGPPERVVATGELYSNGAAWIPDGREIVFSAETGTRGGLWRTAVGKSAQPRNLAITSEDAWAPAVSRRGNRLAYAIPKENWGIWRVDLRDPARRPGVPFKLIPSTRNDGDPAYSPDGTRIAFASDRSGNFEIWVCNSDGSNAVQLTSLGGEADGPKWSSDGASIVFQALIGRNLDIYVMNSNGSAPRRLTSDPADDGWPCWSRDGQSIYFRSFRSGRTEIWKMPAAGGGAVQITRNSGDVPQESPDGRYLYYYKGDPYPTSCSLWRMPVGGGEETKVLDFVHCAGHWSVSEQGIYFFAKPDEKGQSDVRFYEFATGRISKVLTIARDIGMNIATSPDGRTILYQQADQSGSDLMLVENFR